MAMKVALLGCGVVGSEVVRLVNEQSEELAARVGTPIEIGGIAVRRIDRDRGVDPALLTTDATALVTRPDIDLVVEVIGGIEPARSLILDAVKAGASGYLLKGMPAERIIEAIQEVRAGGTVIQPNLARRLLRHFQVAPVDSADRLVPEVVQPLAQEPALRPLSDRETEISPLRMPSVTASTRLLTSSFW